MPPDDISAIKTRLSTERDKLLASLSNIPPATALRSFQGGWSIKDVLAHVAVAESVNVRFARMMIAKDSPVQVVEFALEYPDFPPPFELDRFNAWMTERWRETSFDQVLDTLRAERTQTLAWLDTLAPEQLDRSGEHAVWGTQTVRGMLRLLSIHDRFHRADVEKRKG